MNLDEMLVQLEEIFKEEGEQVLLIGLSTSEQLETLQKLSRKVGKKQNRYSIHSEEYAALKEQRGLVENVLSILLQMQKTQSGLKAVSDKNGLEQDAKVQAEGTGNECESRSVTDTSDCGYTVEYMKELQKEYKEAYGKEDIFKMQCLYNEVYMHVKEEPGKAAYLLREFAEIERKSKGNVAGLYRYSVKNEYAPSMSGFSMLLADGNLVPKDRIEARQLLEKSAEAGRTAAIYTLACELSGTMNKYGFEKDLPRAYALFKQCVQLCMPLNKESQKHQHALYQCYRIGAQLQIDLEKEKIPLSWEWLLDCEGKYGRLARSLGGDILVGQKRYDEAVDAYLKVKTVKAIRAVEELIFDDYYMQQPEKMQRLESVLENIRDDINTDSEVRAELYSWYGWRYENGKHAIKNKALAYVYYLKLLRVENWENVPGYLNKMTAGYSKDELLIFYRDVIDAGGYEASEKLGDLYLEKSMYDKALEEYEIGSIYGYREEIRNACRERYAECKKIVDRQRLERNQCEGLYEQCLGGISMRKSAFGQLRSMARNGNAYAALYVAQLAETDAYLKQNVEDFPTEYQILDYYYDAAKAGVREAVLRLVDVYDKGQLGEGRNTFHLDILKKSNMKNLKNYNKSV